MIREHKATWDYVKELPVRLTIDKNQKLQECEIHFEVLQEYHEGTKGRVQLGSVKLNLAEYTNPPDLDERERDGDANTEPDEDEDVSGITRRYLMQDSKINSTLKIGFDMKQTEGETDFIAPPLKTATVFGGIAGVVSTEPGHDGNEIPSITNKTRELGELQDVYRRNLAATWACMAGELPPDKLIEDLFAGGDGGRMEPPQNPAGGFQLSHSNQHPRDDSAGSSTSDSESRRTVTPHHLSPDLIRNHRGFGGQHSHNHDNGHRKSHQRRVGSRSQDTPGGSASSTITSNTSASDHALPGGPVGRASIEQQIQHHPHMHRNTREHGHYQEVTEFDIREDLRSWQIKSH